MMLIKSILEKIFRENNHDLESLAPIFQAERFLELLDKEGLMLVGKQDADQISST